jgi:multiple antibiotic resistance protein
MISNYGFWPTVISVLLNILLAGLIFKSSSTLMRFVGDAGTKAMSKIMSLLLAAIAVMLIRKGLAQLLH